MDKNAYEILEDCTGIQAFHYMNTGETIDKSDPRFERILEAHYREHGRVMITSESKPPHLGL